MTTHSTVAFDAMMKGVNDMNAQRVVNAVNSVSGVAIADHFYALAQMVGQLVRQAPQDLREDIWVGFCQIVERTMALDTSRVKP